jgi:hypothetical protein
MRKCYNSSFVSNVLLTCVSNLSMANYMATYLLQKKWVRNFENTAFATYISCPLNNRHHA